MTSIGWVARRKGYNVFGGHNARCKVYSTRKMALGHQRARLRVELSGSGLRNWTYRPETDDEVLAKWDIVEVFAEFPPC